MTWAIRIYQSPTVGTAGRERGTSGTVGARPRLRRAAGRLAGWLSIAAATVLLLSAASGAAVPTLSVAVASTLPPVGPQPTLVTTPPVVVGTPFRLPDLVITPITSSRQIDTNALQHFTFSVANRGPVDAPPGTQIRVRLPILFGYFGGGAGTTVQGTPFSCSGDYSYTEIAVTCISQVPLASGGTATTFDVLTYAPGTPATYALTAEADPSLRIRELREDNNTYVEYWNVTFPGGH
jgi:hypothetical protein